MKVDVYLPNGDSCSVEVSPAILVSELKAAVQQHFRRPLKVTAKGRRLDLTATLSEAGLQDGDVVTAVVQLGKLATTSAFALHGHWGEVVSWGEPQHGGDSSQVQGPMSSTCKQPTLLLLPFWNLGLGCCDLR